MGKEESIGQGGALLRGRVMRETVWNCYKRLVWVGRTYPAGWASIRDKVKAAFLSNAHVSNDEEVASLVARAEFVERELEALRKLHK